MALLNEALKCLKPTSWESVPQSPEELREYVREIFKNGRLVGESLPNPPPYDAGLHSETCVVPSAARMRETDPEITSVQEQWGKPMKVDPLGIHVWKLSANDGGGSWFGRRSVHEGMPFTRWKEKISSEYDETLRVNRKKLEMGEVPDKAIRGIGAERKVETVEVKDEDGSVMAQVTVYHVSAQFPKPTSPRDFVAMIITSENGLQIGGTKLPGRSWMMVSKPCKHPDVPDREGYTRGEYESVEIIREIPNTSSSGSSSTDSLGEKRSSPRSTPNSNAAKHSTDGLGDEDEAKPVEWIMVSRSDPGGSIPRWMVDKGTPKSVGQDVAKFINWAAQDKETQEEEYIAEDGSAKVNTATTRKSGESVDEPDRDEDQSNDSDSEFTDSDVQSHHGLIASVTGLINAGIGRFAPYGMSEYTSHPSHLHLDDSNEDQDTENEEEKASSTTSKSNRPHHSRNMTEASLASAHSESTVPVVDEVVNNVMKEKTGKDKPTTHEKDLKKLAVRKQEVETRMETVRNELEKLQGPTQSGFGTPVKGVKDGDSLKSEAFKRVSETRSSTPISSSGTQTSQRGYSSEGQASQSQSQIPRSSARNQKAVTRLVAEQAKLVKRLRKIETDQLKIATKIEARHKKNAERSEKSKSKSEVEILRQEVKDLKKEVSKLRGERQNWVDIVAALQTENNSLHAKNARLSGKEEPMEE